MSVGVPPRFAGAAFTVQRFEVQDRLAEIDARVGKSEGSYDGRKSGKAKTFSRQIFLQRVFADAGRDVGQEFAQFLPFLSAGGDAVVTLEQHAEVVLQAQFNSILESDRNRFRFYGSLGNASVVGVLVQRGRDLDAGGRV